MANEEIPGASEPTPDLRVLLTRIQQLEADVAELRRQIAEKPGRLWAKSFAPAASQTATPPPPPAFKAETFPAETPQWPMPQGDLPSEPAQSASPALARQSLESRLGSQYFNRIAIVLLLTGTAYAMKLAVDRGFIGPTPRVILGLLAGAGLVLWSERFRKRGFALFSYSLKALGTGVLYLALWAAFRLYHLLPAPLALLLMVLVTAWNAYMAWAQNAQLLAGYAMAGAFATPILLSTAGDHEVFLFTYLLAIDAATAVLVRVRRWPRLLLAAFPLTALYFGGWYSEYFASADEFGVTCFFIALFGGVFATVPLWQATPPEDPSDPVRSRRMGVLENILLPLANAAFTALAFYSVLQDSDRHAWLPWLMIALAAVYLVIMKLPQSKVAAAIHLSLAVVFLTIAIPLKASGHWITVSWLVEGVALMWASTRLVEADEATAYAARTLRWLAMASLLLGFCGMCFQVMDTLGLQSLPFFNRGTGTVVTGILAFAAAAWLASQTNAELGETDRKAWRDTVNLTAALVPVTAALLTLRELVSWADLLHAPFQTAEFLTAVLALAVFAAVIAVAVRQRAASLHEPFWTNTAALATIAFNVIAVLTGVREVSAMFAAAPGALTPDAALQQSLAISGFLMLYGAALLAVGFWKRNGFLRWQALALLVFTISKAFLYDMRSLSQGYRVVSLLALGVLLLGISFAYQKDWLNLKAARPLSGEQEAP